jgi:diphosphomevalonate decarboxylase
MEKSGKSTWRSPSNIALVKYWGKKGFQIPANPSVSMSLTNCYTETSIEYFRKTGLNEPALSFLFGRKPNILFEKRLKKYIDIVKEEYPQLKDLNLKIESDNSFPTSAGIASSASSYSSIALCLATIIGEVSGVENGDDMFFRRASSLARLGSGSAGRSVYGGWVLWGKTPEISSSSDEYAIPVTELVNGKFKEIYDSILVVSSGEKSASSSYGHSMMEANPYKEVRISRGMSNAKTLLQTLINGDVENFVTIVEEEAADLHAMLLTSKPGVILIKPETLTIISKLRQFRRDTGSKVCFTLDAGPNVHILYPAESRESIVSFIRSDLIDLCENGKWIDDKTGNGPELIIN